MAFIRPSKKTEGVENAITALTGVDRRKVISENSCAPFPIGCGKVIQAGEFECYDNVTRREYAISGMCGDCQNSFFE